MLFKAIIKEMVTTASAFAGTSTALPQMALGQRPRRKWRGKLRQEAVATQCQTPGAQYHTSIKSDRVVCEVVLPHNLTLSTPDAALLERNLHNALELVLKPYVMASHDGC